MFTRGFGDDARPFDFDEDSSNPSPEPEENTTTKDPLIIPELPTTIRATPDFWVSEKHKAMLSTAFVIAEHHGHSVGYLTGPSGYGKTTLVKKFAEAIGYKYAYFPLAGVLVEEELFGVRGAKKGDTTFEPTVLAQALEEEGIVICLDEATRVPPNVLNPLLSLTHDDGHFPLHGHDYFARWGTIFMFTANIGAEYVGTFEIDPALESRLNVQLVLDSIPPNIEVEVIRNRLNCDVRIAEYATVVMRYGRTLLTMRDSSPRASIGLARLVSAGLKPAWALSTYASSIYDEVERKNFIDFTHSLEVGGAKVSHELKAVEAENGKFDD